MNPAVKPQQLPFLRKSMMRAAHPPFTIALTALVLNLTTGMAAEPLGVDPYGGIKALRGKATGVFHLEKVGKQGLLREDGGPYETLVNHVRDANREQMRRFAQGLAPRGQGAILVHRPVRRKDQS